MKMQKFIQVNGVVINPDHIVSATSEKDSSQLFQVTLTLTSQVESSRASCLGGGTRTLQLRYLQSFYLMAKRPRLFGLG